MSLERRVAFIERAIQCLRCSQGNSTNFGGITPTFTNLTASDIGATSTSTPEDIRQLLSDYIAVNPIIIGQNEIRYVQVDGNTYVIQNTLPGVISIVQPEDFIQISSLNENFDTTAASEANTAAQAANNAATAANTAKDAANGAATNATTATTNANTATTNATNAANTANASAANADAKALLAETAAANANTATANYSQKLTEINTAVSGANTAKDAAQTAANNANTSAQAANNAAQNAVTGSTSLGTITPSSTIPAEGNIWGFAGEGTYPNAGNITVEAGKFAILSRVGTTWSKVEVATLNGKSAYEVAVANGFVGTEAEWLESLEADPAKLLLYSAIKSANISEGTQFIDDENGNIQYRVKTGQTLLTTELPANVVGIKVESIGISKLPNTYPANIMGSCYINNGVVIDGVNFKRTGKIKIPYDVDVWAKVGSSAPTACVIYNEATVVWKFHSTNNEWQKIEINTEWTHIALSGTNEFDCILEFRENEYTKNVSEFIDSKGLIEHSIPFYRGIAVNPTTGVEYYETVLKSTNYIDVTDKTVMASGLFNDNPESACFCYDSNYSYLGKIYSKYSSIPVSDWTPTYLSGTKYVRFGSLVGNTATVIVKGYWGNLINSIPGIQTTNESQEKKVTTALSDVFYTYGDNWKKITDTKSYANYGIIWAGQSNAEPYAPFSSLETYGLPTTLPVKDFNASYTFDANMTIPNTDNAWGLYWSLLSRLYSYNSSREYRIIRLAVGATNLSEDWNPLVSLKQFNTLHHLITRVNAAKTLASLTNFKVMIWVQGEADSGNKTSADAYYQNLKNFIFFNRGLVGNPRLPFICVGVHSKSNGYYNYGDIVRKAMIDVCAEIHDCYFIDTAPLDASFKDGIHYDGAYNEKIAPLIFDIIKNF